MCCDYRSLGQNPKVPVVLQPGTLATYMSLEWLLDPFWYRCHLRTVFRMAAVGVTSIKPGPQTLSADCTFLVHHWGPLTWCSIPDGNDMYLCGVLITHPCTRSWSWCFFLSPFLILASWLGHFEGALNRCCDCCHSWVIAELKSQTLGWGNGSFGKVLPTCPSYLSVAVRRHHDQGNHGGWNRNGPHRLIYVNAQRVALGSVLMLE